MLSPFLKFFYRLLIRPLIAITKLIPFRNSKIRLTLAIREFHDWPARPDGDLIWIHAASGEFEYAKPVIHQIKLERAQVTILVTYFSPSFEKTIREFSGVDIAIPLPWDRTADAQKFIAHFRPDILAIARTDLWPNFIAESRRARIPVFVFSAMISTSKTNGALARAWFQACYESVDVLGVVTATDARRARGLVGNTTLRILPWGDTRFDQVRARLLHPKQLKENLRPMQDRPVLLLGSTWPEDEFHWLPVIEKCIRSQSFHVILVPHEPTLEHLIDIENQLARRKIGSIRYTQSESPANENQVLIVDKIGILAELYQWTTLAFIGGSFGRGVHSVMEGLAAGCPILVGPWHLNNQEATDFQKVKLTERLNAVTCASDEIDISKWLTTAAEEMIMHSSLKSQIQNEITSREGASVAVCDAILRAMDHTRQNRPR